MFEPVPPPRSIASSCLCLVLAAMVASAAAPAWSQTTYKCGTSYSQNPCEGGAALDTDDKRTADQKRQALNATQKEKQAADNLEQSRLAKEKRVAAELKKTNAAKKKVTAKPEKTTVRPIKNRNIKPAPGLLAEKSVKNKPDKKSKAAEAGEK